MENRHEAWNLIDTCYGMTGGDLYVCPRCKSRAVVRAEAPAPDLGPIAGPPCGTPAASATAEEKDTRCRHGWKGTSAELISTPCPACGMRSLFIGGGGHLTCGNLSCKEPGVQSEINNLRAAIEDGLLTLVAISTQPATADRLWGENPTLATTLARLRKALRQMEPADPLARRSS